MYGENVSAGVVRANVRLHGHVRDVPAPKGGLLINPTTPIREIVSTYPRLGYSWIFTCPYRVRRFEETRQLCGCCGASICFGCVWRIGGGVGGKVFYGGVVKYGIDSFGIEGGGFGTGEVDKWNVWLISFFK